MRQRPTLNWKLALAVSLLLPLVMALFHYLWPDISWGFHLLFGLQVMLLLATLHLVLGSLWGPGIRWNLPRPSLDPQRLIFVKKGLRLAGFRTKLQGLKGGLQAVLGRLLKRQTP